MRPNRKVVVIGVACVAVAALVVLAALAFQSYEVVDRERLLPFPDSGRVYEIRVFDSFTVYVDPEAKRGFDILNVYMLAAISGIGLLAAILLRGIGGPNSRRLMWFFLLVWLGAGFLAADEGLGLHETVGGNLAFLADLPGVDRPDDALFASYAIPALIFLVAFRDLLLFSRKALLFLGPGLGLFLLAALFDVTGVHADEVAELLASGCLLAGFTVLAVEHVRNAMVGANRVAGRPAG